MAFYFESPSLPSLLSRFHPPLRCDMPASVASGEVTAPGGWQQGFVNLASLRSPWLGPTSHQSRDSSLKKIAHYNVHETRSALEDKKCLTDLSEHFILRRRAEMINRINRD